MQSEEFPLANYDTVTIEMKSTNTNSQDGSIQWCSTNTFHHTERGGVQQLTENVVPRVRLIS